MRGPKTPSGTQISEFTDAQSGLQTLSTKPTVTVSGEHANAKHALEICADILHPPVAPV